MTEFAGIVPVSADCLHASGEIAWLLHDCMTSTMTVDGLTAWTWGK